MASEVRLTETTGRENSLNSLFSTKTADARARLEDRRYSSSEVSRLSGATLRQIQTLDEKGIVKPTKDGHNRSYSADDLAAVIGVTGLRNSGVSLQRIRAALLTGQGGTPEGITEVVDQDNQVLTLIAME